MYFIVINLLRLYKQKFANFWWFKHVHQLQNNLGNNMYVTTSQTTKCGRKYWKVSHNTYLIKFSIWTLAIILPLEES